LLEIGLSIACSFLLGVEITYSCTEIVGSQSWHSEKTQVSTQISEFGHFPYEFYSGGAVTVGRIVIARLFVK